MLPQYSAKLLLVANLFKEFQRATTLKQISVEQERQAIKQCYTEQIYKNKLALIPFCGVSLQFTSDSRCHLVCYNSEWHYVELSSVKNTSYYNQLEH
jgi:hypothetical protein